MDYPCTQKTPEGVFLVPGRGLVPRLLIRFPSTTFVKNESCARSSHKYRWTRLAVFVINHSDILRRSSPHARQAVASLPGHIKKRHVALFYMCPGEDSNLHTLRHTHLKRTCLPISPPGQNLNNELRIKNYGSRSKEAGGNPRLPPASFSCARERIRTSTSAMDTSPSS